MNSSNNNGLPSTSPMFGVIYSSQELKVIPHAPGMSKRISGHQTHIATALHVNSNVFQPPCLPIK